MPSPAPARLIVRPRAAIAAEAAAWIAAEVRAAVAERGACALALAGGNTPRAVYAELAARPDELPWSRVQVYFGDERAVPPSDPHSNFHMAWETLLRHVPVPPAGVHRMEAERADRDAAARAYEAVLPDRLDLLLLGVGEDGHTASLFPGAPTLGEERRRVLPAVSPLPPVHRLTITPPVIASAVRTLVIAVGAGKASPVARALDASTDPREVPARLARDGVWMLDDDAASRLAPVRA
ncbi:MAG TPA: 6-phosphogluconolactonase [Gemmatimonadaceae bacterium]